MGRPIKKSWFGDVTNPGYQLTITGKLPGVAVGSTTGVQIVAQKGSKKYLITNGTDRGIVKLVNTLTPASLADGEGFISVTPFGGSAKAIHKLTQHRVSVYDTVDDANSTISSYTWGEIPATTAGQADVIDDATDDPVTALGTIVFVDGPLHGAVTAVSIATAGTGYTVNDVLTFAGEGSGSGLTLTVATVGGGGDITGVTITTAGTGYETTDAGLAATGGTGTLADFDIDTVIEDNMVDSVTITDEGREYVSAPTVTFSVGTGGGASPKTATGTSTISNGEVSGVDITAVGSYTNAETGTATVTFAAP